MNEIIKRREFTWLASSGVCGLFVAPAFGAEPAPGPGPGETPETDPAAKRLVLLGLNALARAHTLSYFADGHRGASLISAHLLCDENELAPEARSRIESLFDANWAKAPLCQPFAESDPDPAQIRKIGEALAEGRGELREVGHNAIFAMLAIKGFRMLPSAATPERIEGVCQLIRAIKPWRDEEPDPEIDPPAFSDAAAASRFVLLEASAAVDRWKGFGQGFSGHMLTFGQALVELAAMGDAEWAESCRQAFRKYVTVTRKGPQAGDRVIADHGASALRPNQTAYWQKRGEKTLGLGHVFKYPYSYYDLMRHVDDAALAREWDGKADQLF
jgi:hypothetical protein